MSEEDRARRVLEGHVEHIASVYGIPIFRHVVARNGFDIFERIRLIKNVPYVNIWGKDGYIEFVLELGSTQQIPIECKYQESDGSVDEKYLKTFFDAAFCLPGKEAVLLFDGKAMDPQIVKTLKSWGGQREIRIAGQSLLIQKAIRVMNRNEFDPWLRNIAKIAE